MPYCSECGEPIRSRNQRCLENGGVCTPDTGGGPGDIAARNRRPVFARGKYRSQAEIPPDFVVITTDRDTYPVREFLKARGCRWDNEDKVWLRPPTVNVDDVLALAPTRTERPAPGAAVDTTGWRRVVGRTYAVRDQLKALGGRFDGTLRAWLVPPDRYAEAQALLRPRN